MMASARCSLHHVALLLMIVAVLAEDITKQRSRRAVKLSDKPKIVTSDGHLSIQSAANHNISLVTDDQGDVNLGGTSIKALLNKLMYLTEDVKKLKQQIAEGGGACAKDLSGAYCGAYGTCVSVPAAVSNGTGYRCVCAYGYKGMKCDQKITRNPCDNVMCLNGGTCKSENRVPVCQCLQGYFGPRCNLQTPSSCSQNFTDSGGVISSIGYPEAYPANMDCTYIIQSTPGKSISLGFIGLRIETSQDCSKDFVEIRDGSSANSKLITKVCGSNKPTSVSSTSNSIYIRFKTDASTQVGSGFSVYYRVQQNGVCGGTLTSDMGSIASPNWPTAYNKAASCSWLVKMPTTERVSYKISQLVLSGTASACNSYLELHDGPDDRSPIIGKFCSNTALSQSLTTSNQLYIKFVTDGTGSLFKMEYTTPCGGNLTGSSGTFQSPYFPNSYPHKKTCVWTITAPPGNVVTVRFPTFDLEPSTNCVYDRVSVINGPAITDPLISRFCGSVPPSPVTSSMNQMTLVFRTDGSDAFRGFQARYTSAPGGCGGAITGTSGNISSPTQAMNYPHSVRCIWTITAADVTRSVQMQFLSFDLEVDPLCRYDYVMLRDGPLVTSPVLYNTTTSGRFCGKRKPPTVTSSAESLTVAFYTDVSIAKVGFSAAWLTVPRTSGCDVFLATSTGSIKSPGYPNNYPHNQLCKFTISVSSGLQIDLMFRDFALERHFSCNYDNVMIYDGTSNQSPLLGKFCGTQSPGRIVSTGNSLHIVFKSDQSSSARGFLANYTTGSSICGGMLYTDSGFIRSPNYPNPYKHNAVCTWIIRIATGNTINFRITDLDIESSTGCRYDHVEFRDGVNSSAALLGRLCGTVQPSVRYKSTRNVLYVSFKSDPNINGRGFELRYTSGCGGVFRDIRGVITSPNYPQYYPSNRVCNYTFFGSIGDVVHINFTEFNLESHSTCRHDYLAVYNGSSVSAPLINKYCGNKGPFSVNSTVNSLFMMFKSDSSVVRKGFRATYELIGCNGILTAPNGSFSTPNYPAYYPVNRVCKWRITVAVGRRIQLNFSEIDLESHRTCDYDYVKIFNGRDETAPLNTSYCSRHGAVTLTSTSNELLVVFKSDGSNAGRGFMATYTSITQGCGGLFTLPYGYIQSPNYPQNYPVNTQCEWTIVVQRGHNVKINFTDFHLETHASCSYDYVQVRDGYGLNATQLARGCGNTTIGVVETTGNVMIVKFRSDGSVTRRGFKAYYSTGCGGTINADVPGVITSPNHPNFYPNNALCIWVLRGTPGRKVTLTFTNFNVEQHSNCDYDYVEVRQGSTASASLIGKYCGTNLPAAITSFGNELYVKFVSDSSTTKSGFRAMYTTATVACGGTLQSSNGTFASPSYPANTPSVSSCNWKIQVAPGSVISLSFLTFNLIQTTSCSAAYVEIRDGQNSSSTLIGRYCGTSLPPTITSTREYLNVKFYHNYNVGSVGFRVQFGAVCDRTITYTQGYITSPNWPSNYPDNKQCIWKIVVPSGRRISVRFTAFDIEDHSACSYDYLEVRNGNTPSSPLIGTYCGTTAPSPFSSSSNLLYLKFQSDYSTTGRGFRLYFDAGVSPGCGGILNAAPQVNYITSPNYPNNYQNNARCVWVINAANAYSVNLTITDFSLESAWVSSCVDYLDIRDGATSSDTRIGRYCGVGSPFTIHSHGSSLYLMFKSDSSVVRRGFRASYQQACGGILSATTGIIRSPSINNKYLPNQNCSWQISVASGAKVQMTFSFFELEQSASCVNDYLLIRNGIAPDSPILARLCTSPSAALTSTNSRVSVQFVTNGATQLRGFMLNYTQYTPGCGGSLSITDPAAIGNVSSPNYGARYPVNVECVWILNVPAGNTILFNFVDFDVETGTSCQFDYVEIRDGGISSSTLLGKFCGRSLPTPSRFLSTGTQLYVKLRSDYSLTGRGFTASWQIGCGKIARASSGTITSPSFPQPYPPNRECKYSIQIPENKQIQVAFTAFNLATASSQCNNDYLAVYDGISANATMISKLCGAQLPGSFLSTGRNLYMVFKSDGSGSGNGFRATYQTVGAACGGNLVGSAGTFTSPNYPLAYPRGRICQWKISVSALHSVRLRFSKFSLQSAASCNTDYVEVYNGDGLSSPLLGRYCGSSLPPILNSTGTNMFVVFNSNSDAYQMSGFSASYTAYLPGCGGNLVAASGTITSPNYPGNYPSNVECAWVLTVPTGSISIIFNDFFVEDHSNCIYDYVEIRDGSSSLAPQVGKICGTRGQGFNYTSHGTTLYVKFRADLSVVRRGFNASWTNAGSAAGQCGGTLQGSSGMITTPLYNRTYPPNLMCVWQIQARSGLQITATIQDMNIETSSLCAKDYLSIQNGASSSSPVLAKLCSSALPAATTYQSTGSVMRVTFKSDAAISGRGVKLMYNQTLQGCGGTYTSPNDTIISPGYPNNHLHNIECEWIINVASADRISIFFNDFSLEDSSTCRYDYLEIRDGSSRSAPLLQKLCGNKIHGPFYSTRNSMYLRLRTDATTALKGFSLTYTTDCGGRIFSKNGIISSPRYPSPYPPNKDCVWQLQVEPHYSLVLTFSSFTLPVPIASSCSDYVQVRNGTNSSSPVVGTYCGLGPQAPVKSLSNTMYVKFHSDASLDSLQGFQANFKAVCGGIITDTQGVISSATRSDGNYYNNELCTWLIRFPAGQRVNLKFLRFGMEYHARCAFDYLEVRDGDAVGAPLLGRFCGSILPPLLISSGNTMNVTFVTDKSVNSNGFSLTYTSAAPRCGGILNTTTGTIRSPNYPSAYPNDEGCEWTILAPAGQKIRVTFTAFNLENPTGITCHDYLQIREGRYPTSPFYASYCGTRGPGTVTSTGNSLFMKFHSDSSINATGFTASYQFVQGCGGRLSVTPSGQTLRSPNYPSNYPTNTYCEWMLTARQGYKVSFTFNDFQLPQAVNGLCSNYLLVRNGPGRTAAVGNRRYCGTKQIAPYTSDGNIIRVILNSTVSAKGFSATYKEAVCGKDFTTSNGLITSPNYPSFHPVDINCVYRIGVTSGSKIQLYFRDFNIESHSNCNYDFLEIRDGNTASAPLIGNRTWCGTVPPPAVFSTGSNLYLRFKSDTSVQTAGFALSYTSSTQRCGGPFSGKMGAVTAPNYPSGYNDLYNCQWQITVGSGKRVQLTFTDFQLPYQASCITTDYVEIQNGASSNVVGQYCGNQLPAQYNSTGNQVTILFKSTSRSLKYRGFKILFDEVM